MIEVEKKFQPTSEQLEKLIDGAQFLGSKSLHDVYYDYPDLRLFKNKLKLRNRNGCFELKIASGDGISQEVEDEKEIKKYLEIDIDLQEFINKNMIVFSDYVNNRKKFKKDGFIIDIDSMDFGYELCEVELLVDDESKIKEAEQKIVNFVESYGINLDRIPSKRELYLKAKNLELYNKLYNENPV